MKITLISITARKLSEQVWNVVIVLAHRPSIIGTTSPLSNWTLNEEIISVDSSEIRKFLNKQIFTRNTGGQWIATTDPSVQFQIPQLWPSNR
jgi:hypothetical protein